MSGPSKRENTIPIEAEVESDPKLRGSGADDEMPIDPIGPSRGDQPDDSINESATEGADDRGRSREPEAATSADATATDDESERPTFERFDP